MSNNIIKKEEKQSKLTDGGKKRINEKILLLCSSFFFTIILILLTELIVRIFFDIPFLGNSKNLFTPDAYGSSYGNAKKIEAISFGEKVYTDENGFRVFKNNASQCQDYDYAVLILGDSVAFGCGVPEENTFTGLLRKNFPKVLIYNSSVIGYGIKDYKNVVDNFLHYHKEIKKVYLIFCLNDIEDRSSESITESLKARQKNLNSNDNYVETIKSIGFFAKLNSYLRAHSKLFVLLKGELTDPQLRYWEAEYLNYKDIPDNVFLERMQPIIEITNILKQKGILFKVIIAPYEYQIRKYDNNLSIPQKRLSHFFETNGISYIDLIDKFRNSKINSKALFLPYDPMHFSKKGHEVMYENLLQ